MAKGTSEPELSKEDQAQYDAVMNDFTSVVSAMVDNDIVNYPFIRQNKETKLFQRIEVRIHVTDLDEDEGKELIKEARKLT